MDYIERFRKAIRINTSWRDGGEQALRRFQRFLARAFPAFHKAAERRIVSPFSVVYRWPAAARKARPAAVKQAVERAGAAKQENPAENAPVLFLAHYDVVPAEAEKWSADPFGAEIREEDGTQYVYGRGALDMKSMLIAILESAEELCEKGFAPERDIWFAFGGDEERAGIAGAKETARILAEEGRRFAWILDEGSPVTEDQIKGIREPLVLVGIEEKGFLSMDLVVEQKPGHASQPPKIQAAAILARALCRIDKRPFPFALDPVVEAFFKGCAKHSGGVQSWVMKHARVLGPLFFRIAAASPVTAALLRTTVAMTMLKGSAADNVMPSAVTAVLNLRLLPPWTVETALARVKETVNDDRVSVRIHGLATDPVPAVPGQENVPGFRKNGGRAASASAGWDKILGAAAAAFPGVPVLPFLMTATTDSRHYSELAGPIYRFNPQVLDPGELSRIHGHDERISLVNLENCRGFYSSLLELL
ncbi:MAG: M20/M25/M40 family metallo-hydrolase [Treponema sp.]|jgi:carboxypeptidase PM20D1|nr:M20/M25/M40 family metallo-hydrolase [Treponema sp.]